MTISDARDGAVPIGGADDRSIIPTPPDEPTTGLVPSRSLGRRVIGDPVGAICLALLLLAGVVAVFSPLLAPYDPAAQNLPDQFAGPSADHWLGTDELGRDVLSRLMYGARTSLAAVLQAIGVMLILALPTGLIAGYIGRWPDLVLGRVADALLSIPGIVLAVAVVTALGPGLTNAMLAVGVGYSPTLFRVTRAATLSVREETYVQAAIVGGCGTARILVRHVLPNVFPPILVQVTIMASLAVLAEAGLSFLGLGVQPPEASWGMMLGEAFQNVYRDWLLMIWPGLCILAASLAFSLLGDVLRDSVGRGRR